MKKVRILKYEEINEKNFQSGSIARAKRIMNNVFLEYKTLRHIGFRVLDFERNSIHSVIYMSEKKKPSDWQCDCTWYSTQSIKTGKYCAHILAIHLKLNKDKEFMKMVLGEEK